MKNPKNLIGYWKRGKNQFWHITEDSALLINNSEPNAHYDGNAHIFFEPQDGPVMNTDGRYRITEVEFELVKTEHIHRLNQF